MPTYFSNKSSVFSDPNKEIYIAPGSTFTSEFYFCDPDLQLVSRAPYWEPIVQSTILSGAAGATVQVENLAEADFIIFAPSDQVKIYFNSMDVTPLFTAKNCMVESWNRVDVVVIEFVVAGDCEVHGLQSSSFSYTD